MYILLKWIVPGISKQIERGDSSLILYFRNFLDYFFDKSILPIFLDLFLLISDYRYGFILCLFSFHLFILL